MAQALILLVVALVLASVGIGVTFLIRGNDPGLVPAEPDGRSIPLPGRRPLAEQDVTDARFDLAARGYRMAQVDRAMDRVAYDIGYKNELIGVLEAEVEALRDGRVDDADVLRDARVAAGAPDPATMVDPLADRGEPLTDGDDFRPFADPAGLATGEDASGPESASGPGDGGAVGEPGAAGQADRAVAGADRAESDPVVAGADPVEADPVEADPAVDDPAVDEPADGVDEPADGVDEPADGVDGAAGAAHAPAGRAARADRPGE